MKTQPGVLVLETGKLLAGLCILFNVFHSACSSSGGKSELTDCEWACADFHRICPAMTNSSYVKELQQEGVAEHLPVRDLLQPYDCSNLVYHYLCPLSCEACIPCAQRSSLAVIEELDTVKQNIADLQEIVDEGESTPPPPKATPPQTTLAGTTTAPSLGTPSSATTVPPTTTTPVPEPVTIPIVTAASCLSFAKGVDTWTVDKALDDNPATIFHSSDKKNAWAKFYIPSSIVKIVKILNRKDCCGHRMTGEEVWVCEGDDCEKCGVFSAVGNGDMGVMSCGGNDGIQGNYVKVVTPNNYLQIAEIEVLGEAQQKVEQVKIQRGESSEIFSEKFPLKYSYDEDESTFLYAKNPLNGWAKYFIPLASVKVVSLQNGPNCCNDRMTGNVVSVCADDTDESCKQCGVITHAVGKKQWVAIDCGGKEGLSGRVVKVAATNSYLQLTEVKIFADIVQPTELLPIKSASSSEVYSSKYTVDKSFDENEDTLFHSKHSKAGWAKYAITPANVKKVRIQNRADCCAERILGNVVSVCVDESDASCSVCGTVVEAVGKRHWVEVSCLNDGIDGTFVMIAATNSYLQLAEVEIYGTETDVKIPTTQAPVTTTTATEKSKGGNIPIIAGSAAPTWTNNPQTWGVEKSLDEDPATIYHSKSRPNGWAKYYIPTSTVNTVEVQNRADCCGHRMGGVEVSVCDGEECQECGKFPHVELGKWATMTCGGEGGIEGSYVKVLAPKDYLQIAQIKIHGTVETELNPAKIKDASSSPIYSSLYPLEKSLDKKGGTFFHAKSPTNGWASYSIDHANVRLVRLQNRADCCADRMTGNVVYVCTDEAGASCKQCGAVIENVLRKQWTVVYCGEGDGIEGNAVKVAATNSYLQIAEIEIYAEKALPIEMLTIVDATSSKIYAQRFALKNSYDKNDNTFFHAKDPAKGWAKYAVKPAAINYVRVQNRPDCCTNRMMGNVVYVCLDETHESCKECGTFVEPVGKKEWGKMTCGDRGGIKGRYVKVAATSSYLQITEIEIYGRGN